MKKFILKKYLLKMLPSLLLITALLITLCQPSFTGYIEAEEGEESVSGEDEEAESGDSGEKAKGILRTEEELLAQAELYAENEYYELFVVENYKYTETVIKKQTAVRVDENGEPMLDEKGKEIKDTIEVPTQVEREEPEAIFALRVKSNGFIWWSSPFDAGQDTVAKPAQKETMNSLIYFDSGNPESHNTSKVTAKKQSVNKKSSKAEKITDGVRFTFEFTERATKVSVEITLDGKSLVAKVPVDSIIEENITGENGSIMISLSLLNSFGCAKEGEDGYIVVPDGSGAVINFDNKKTNTTPYSGQVYGRDYAVSLLKAPPVNEQVYFPMYGIVRKNGEKGDNALVAVAEQGDESAIIKANVSRQSTTLYNAAWFDFKTRTTDSYYIGTKQNELNVFEPGEIKTGDIAVRYFPLAGDDLSYMDVAETYREYLISTLDLKSKTSSVSAPYYLTLEGGTVKTHSIAGFPVDMQTAGTTYNQAGEIINMLKDGGVGDIILTYNDFNKAGIQRKISPTVQYSSMLGGKNDFQKLAEQAVNAGVSLYPVFNIMEYHSSGNGYSYLLNSSKQITKAYASQTKYEFAFGTQDPFADSWTILSPYYYSGLFDKILESLKTEGINSISLNQATTLLYSDFSRKNPNGGDYFNRRDATEELKKGYQKFNDAGISLLAKSANAYALPYVNRITDVPLYSSNYDIFDYDIPLYAMIIHGLIPYTTKAFNSSSESGLLRLKALASGTPIHYNFMYVNPKEFTDSDYNKKFYANYQGWLDRSVNEYKMFNELIADVSDQRITDYKVSGYESETTFENGKTIYVNTDTGEARVNGQTVNWTDYGLKGGNG